MNKKFQWERINKAKNFGVNLQRKIGSDKSYRNLGAEKLCGTAVPTIHNKSVTSQFIVEIVWTAYYFKRKMKTWP